MAARRRSHADGGSGFVAVVVLLLVVGLIIKYIWWIVGAGALVGLIFVGRAVAREVEKRRELAEQREFQLKRRADRQHRWMLTGDPRAVYGQEGAAAMRRVAPTISLPGGKDAAAQENLPIAKMAATAGELAALVNDKPQEWQWALFTSVLVQRTAPLLPRLRDSELRFTPASTTRVYSGPELARSLVGLIDEMLSTASQLESFTVTPAFMDSFREHADGSPADAEAITHIANRVMDYHERFLELSERCRGLSVPSHYAAVLTDCARLLDIPLQSYREFIGELVDVIEALPQLLQHATGVVNMGSVVLDIDIDDQLRSRIFKRLEAISRS
jgi:hypothetical protein